MFIKNLEKYNPKNEYSEFIKEYFIWISNIWVNKYILNLNIEIKFIEIDSFLIPLCFWNNLDNCYTASFLSIFNYWKYELKNIKNIFTKKIFNIIINIFIFFWKKIHLDEDIVYVNNFMLSTNLYPDFKKDTLIKINNFISKKYPNKIIVYRTLNSFCNKCIISTLDKYWFKKIVSRQIFIFNSIYNREYKKLKIVKNDFRILRKYWFVFKKVELKDSNKILELYNKLYIEKYTKMNPQFTVDFIKKLILNKYFYFYKLLDGNKIIWVIWYYYINNQVTTPIFGYDTTYNKKYNLYSQVSNLLTFNSLDKFDILNSSSWAWNFKIARWWKKYIEYNYIKIPKKNLFLRKFYFYFLFLLSNKVILNNLKSNVY